MTRHVISGAVGPKDLASLKRIFFGEIRRNAFEVFLRPRKTLIKLMSASISSSTAFPLGEAFRFSFSPNGQMLLCISSSRIFVLDVASEPAVVRHELKTPRRPIGATILDDGSLLAVASSKDQVNIYSLSDQEAKHTQVLMLDDVPRALALSPTGGVLAMAYDDSIEVYALGKGVLAPQRRAVRCMGVDSISFSSDEMMLLGSSVDPQRNSIVTITAPFYTESGTDLTPQDVQVRVWTTQILFPNIIPGYSHAGLIPLHAEGEDNWVIAYDEQIRTFRAVSVNGARVGTTYFVTPPADDRSAELPSPITIPATDYKGELAALGFQDSGLWLYGIPERLDIAPSSNSTLGTHEAFDGSQNNIPFFYDHSLGESSAPSQDDSLSLHRVASQQKILISGHKMADIPGITAFRWVRPVHSVSGGKIGHHRLVAVAPGGVNPPTLGEEDVPVDGGRVLLLDFERSTKNGETLEVNIELGETEPMMLREYNPSMDAAVELERSRTRLHRGDTGSGACLRQRPSRPSFRGTYPAAAGGSQKIQPRNFRNSSYVPGSSDDMDTDHVPLVDDSPYSNTQPRSRDTLRRAATAAAAIHGRYNPRNRDEPGPQIPHESDADNWVPPPPPYTREPDGPLPDYLRRTLLPRNSPVQRVQRPETVAGTRMASWRRRDLSNNESNRQSRLFQSHSQPLLDRSEPPQEAQSQQRPVTSGAMLTAENPLSSQLLDPALQAPSHSAAASFIPSQPAMDDWTGRRPSYPYASHHSYSVSSPNLNLADQSNFFQDIPQQSTGAATFQGSAEPHQQFQDGQLPIPGIGGVGRRVSTDPTPEPLRQNANEEWRRRIEEWNERTIHERSRRSRIRCIVM